MRFIFGGREFGSKFGWAKQWPMYFVVVSDYATSGSGKCIYIRLFFVDIFEFVTYITYDYNIIFDKITHRYSIT